MIISRTPFRISFFGGGTDYPAWYRVHGGAVLASTINKYCYISCRYLPPFFQHRTRVVYSQVENCHGIDDIKHPAVRAVLKYLKIDRGVEIHHDGDLPARSGLGSSSAFTVGLIHAMHALKGYMPDKHQLAREGIYIEREQLAEAVGSQDQVLAAFGGFTHITFSPDDEFFVRPVLLSRDRLAELNSHLMLFFTGISRTASEIAKSYVDSVHKNEQQLRLIGDMVSEAMSILNTGQDITSFGRLLHEGWKAKRALSSKVSNPDVEQIYEEAMRAGALGGKLIGAGGGGFMLLFVPPQNQENVRGSLNKLICVPFKFENKGTQVIFYEPEDDYSAEEQARAVQGVGPFKEFRTRAAS